MSRHCPAGTELLSHAVVVAVLRLAHELNGGRDARCRPIRAASRDGVGLRESRMSAFLDDSRIWGSRKGESPYGRAAND